MFKYHIKLKDGHKFSDLIEHQHGEVHIVKELPETEIESVTAVVPMRLLPGEKIFMNGFQTWTYCPEYEQKDKINGLRHLPKAAVRHFGLDRYGDNYFVDYPEKKGVTHGESWCYFRHGDKYRLVASLDEHNGYTLFKYDNNEGCLHIEKDCKGLKVSGKFSAFDLFFAEGTEDEVFDAWFKAMGISPRTTERMTGYSSWYNRYQDINDESITADLKGCSEVLIEGDLFQIDDGWEPFVGDWLEPDKKKFPRGMKASVDDIHAKGFKAGLWLAPFVCQQGSFIKQNHPDWLLQVNNEPWYCGCNWGGFWSLDIDKPAVVEYLEKVFDRVFNEWGFDLVKLDFLYAAAPYGSDRETRAGRMIRAMELLRRLCGDKLILGCGVPVMPAFGLVDYCRISCDVGLDWNDNIVMQHAHRERVSTRQAIGNSIFRRQLNGRAYLSDPDVFFFRDDNIKLTKEQKHVLATINSLFGGLLLTSDNMAKYTPEAKAAYKQLLRNRDAKNIKVHNEKGLSVSYELDGKTYTVVIDK